jgi:hypothetical protein
MKMPGPKLQTPNNLLGWSDALGSLGCWNLEFVWDLGFEIGNL